MQEYFSNKTIENLKYELVREKLLSYEQLSHAEETAAQKGINIGVALVEEKIISEERLLSFIQDCLHIPYVNLEDYSIDKKVLELINRDDAKKFRVMPMFKIEDVLTVAMSDPLNLFVLNSLFNIFKDYKDAEFKIEPVICAERLILEKIEAFYFPENQQGMELIPVKYFNWREEIDLTVINEFQAEKIFELIIFQAVYENVHEIIFENSAEGKLVKFKKLGKIEDKGFIPALFSPLFNSKLKTASGISLNKNNLPQLGKFNMDVNGENIKVVVSTFPTMKGERIALKIYKSPQDIQSLAIDAPQMEFIEKCLEEAGIIIIAGPDLSGKSFVAYSLLNSMDRKNKNIMTVESVVKYDLEGINQCEINEKAGFHLEKAFNFIDFQSPDIIYCEETSNEAIIRYLAALAQEGKTLIVEIRADNEECLYNKLNSEKYKEFKQNVKCLIFVYNKDRIQII